MFRKLVGSEAGALDNFSGTFECGVVSFKKPKHLFILIPSHIAAPPTTHMGLTTSISNKIPFITLAPVTLPVTTFTRACVTTFVNY